MKKQLLSLPAVFSAAIIISTSFVSITHAQTAPPPSFGEETKGAPAIEEPSANKKPSANNEPSAPETASAATESPANPEESETEAQSTKIFGNATVVESRRESGQVYSIELQHSNAPTQYIEETDSDGDIEFEAKDIEDTPNLPKWKLGSW